MTDYVPTSASYDSIADAYAEFFGTEIDRKPWSQAALTAFAATVSGPVADVSCGPGRTTGFLHRLGVDVFGIDLSTGMIDVARREHPDVRFEHGCMDALDIPDAALGGIVAWYSVIHTEPADLPGVFAEFRRVLRPGGQLLLAFQIGETPLHLTDAFGHSVDLVFHRFTPEQVSTLLEEAGLQVTATLTRQADPNERTPQAHLVAQKGIAA